MTGIVTADHKKTAFVTGVTGQDGSYLVELLLNKGYRVIGAKRRTSTICTDRVDHLFEDKNFILEYYDLNDTSRTWQLINKYRPDEIYNLAAMSHVRVSFDIPENTVDGIAMGTLRLLNACKELVPDSKFYQASSSEMFGDNPNYPFNEESKLMPASPYACAKVFAHNLCRNYRLAYNMHVSSGILFNHESPRRGETFVTRKITLAAAKIKQGLQDRLFLGNLEAKRDWGFAGDYAEAMWIMLQQDVPDDYVIATGETHTVREFLEEVFSHAGLDVEKHLHIDPRLFRPHEVPYLLGNPEKAKNKLNWEPKITFKKLAKKMYDEDYELVKRLKRRIK
ncbi:MAG TPA: GDP-mannose 4,6-dehydratase [Balneola sp.]|nr:GDP-mannose 4,6-dehydratase [Balneola sp.]